MVIVGGGVAGIAAAVRLADAGVAVRLIETRKRLGGRATSFVDPASGQLLDNCQHVLMRCCTNLLDLYKRLGVDGQIQWHRRLYFAGRTGGTGLIDKLEADDLPAPLHLMRSMLGFRFLSWKEKWAIGRAMRAIMRTSKPERDRLDNQSFASWLEHHNQPRGTIDKYWQVVVVSACNESLANTSAKYALQVFQEGFLHNTDAYEMGLAAVPLVELYDAAQRVLEDAGGAVELSTSATEFVCSGKQVTALKVGNGEDVQGDVFISAVPFDRLSKLCSQNMLEVDARLRRLSEIEFSPIIGIHLFFRTSNGQAVMDLPHLALTDSPIQWVFNKGISAQQWGAAESAELCEHLHCVISAAHDLVDAPAADLEALALSELGRVLPALKDAQLVHARAIKEKRATFSLRPGLDRYRPSTTGAIANLLLAGDWCDTGWPATMEGAVRSGYRAAQGAAGLLGVEAEPMLVDDLKPGALYRLLSR